MKKTILCLFILLLFPLNVRADSNVETKAGVNLIPNGESKPILNPDNPSEKITVIDNLDESIQIAEGDRGILTIDYVSNFQFGTKTKDSKTIKALAKKQQALDSKNQQIEVSNFIQVTDTRGNNAGWKLTVKQASQFTTTSPVKGQLEGAFIELANGSFSSAIEKGLWINKNTVVSLNEEQLVMRAPSGKGGGTCILYWGGEGVSLTIPGSSTKLAQTYSSELQWCLSDTPG